MPPSIYIEEYSTKSFVVRGETSEHKESIKAMGGKWNSRLTDKDTGDKFGAWLFWSDKRKEVDNWLKKGCVEIENNREIKKITRDFSNTNSDSQTSNRLEAKIDRLTKMLEAICSIHDIDINEHKSTPYKNKIKSVLDEFVIEDDDDDDVEDKIPPKRLLGKK